MLPKLCTALYFISFHSNINIIITILLLLLSPVLMSAYNCFKYYYMQFFLTILSQTWDWTIHSLTFVVKKLQVCFFYAFHFYSYFFKTQ